MHLRANVRVPQLLAVVIEGEHTRLAEENIEPLSVCYRRAGGVAMIAHLGLFGQSCFDRIGPHRLAVGAIETNHMPVQRVDVTARAARHRVAGITRDENAIAEHDGTGSTG